MRLSKMQLFVVALVFILTVVSSETEASFIFVCGSTLKVPSIQDVNLKSINANVPVSLYRILTREGRDCTWRFTVSKGGPLNEIFMIVILVIMSTPKVCYVPISVFNDTRKSTFDVCKKNLIKGLVLTARESITISKSRNTKFSFAMLVFFDSASKGHIRVLTFEDDMQVIPLFKSPNYPRQFPSGIYAQWILPSIPHNHQLQLVFFRFDMTRNKCSQEAFWIKRLSYYHTDLIFHVCATKTATMLMKSLEPSERHVLSLYSKPQFRLSPAMTSPPQNFGFVGAAFMTSKECGAISNKNKGNIIAPMHLYSGSGTFTCVWFNSPSPIQTGKLKAFIILHHLHPINKMTAVTIYTVEKFEDGFKKKAEYKTVPENSLVVGDHFAVRFTSNTKLASFDLSFIYTTEGCGEVIKITDSKTKFFLLRDKIYCSWYYHSDRQFMVTVDNQQFGFKTCLNYRIDVYDGSINQQFDKAVTRFCRNKKDNISFSTNRVLIIASGYIGLNSLKIVIDFNKKASSTTLLTSSQSVDQTYLQTSTMTVRPSKFWSSMHLSSNLLTGLPSWRIHPSTREISSPEPSIEIKYDTLAPTCSWSLTSDIFTTEFACSTSLFKNITKGVVTAVTSEINSSAKQLVMILSLTAVGALTLVVCVYALVFHYRKRKKNLIRTKGSQKPLVAVFHKDFINGGFEDKADVSDCQINSVYEQAERPVYQQAERPVYQQAEGPVYQQAEGPIYQQFEHSGYTTTESNKNSENPSYGVLHLNAEESLEKSAENPSYAPVTPITNGQTKNESELLSSNPIYESTSKQVKSEKHSSNPLYGSRECIFKDDDISSDNPLYDSSSECPSMTLDESCAAITQNKSIAANDYALPDSLVPMTSSHYECAFD